MGGYKMKPHKHAELIIAWANGAEIEQYGLTENNEVYWSPCLTHTWENLAIYRIKPESKPDVSKYTTAERGHSLLNLLTVHFDNDNLKLTFDGETGQLKYAEVIK